MKVLVVSNRKGGVGKTTVASDLANEIRRQGFVTVLIDMDSQCDLTKIYLDEGHGLPTRTCLREDYDACLEVREGLGGPFLTPLRAVDRRHKYYQFYK